MCASKIGISAASIGPATIRSMTQGRSHHRRTSHLLTRERARRPGRNCPRVTAERMFRQSMAPAPPGGGRRSVSGPKAIGKSATTSTITPSPAATIAPKGSPPSSTHYPPRPNWVREGRAAVNILGLGTSGTGRLASGQNPVGSKRTGIRPKPRSGLTSGTER